MHKLFKFMSTKTGLKLFKITELTSETQVKEGNIISFFLYNIFNIDEFKQINKLFTNKLIQKTML